MNVYLQPAYIFMGTCLIKPDLNLDTLYRNALNPNVIRRTVLRPTALRCNRCGCKSTAAELCQDVCQQQLFLLPCVSVPRYVGVCCPEGQEDSVIGNADGGLPGSEAAGQLPAIDPGLPGSGLGVSTPTPAQVRGQ
jgi:hypothetical protein